MSDRKRGPRPGFVLEVDRSTPPTLFWHGEGFRLEKLPVGSRVIYAPEPLDAIADPRGAIRHALANPIGDSEPLDALLFSGMNVAAIQPSHCSPTYSTDFGPITPR